MTAPTAHPVRRLPRAPRLVRLARGVHRRVAADGERGTTMVELAVTTIIMAICGAIFTGAVVTLSRTSNQVQAISNTAVQNNQAYQALDKTVRYAAAISTPGKGTTTGDWYVELSDTTSGAEVCTQLRVDIATRLLQRRTWTVTTGTNTPSAWLTLAVEVTNGSAVAGSATQPFVLRTPSATAAHQRLGITTVSRSGPASQPVSSTSSYDLTALNSPAVPTSTSICQQVSRP